MEGVEYLSTFSLEENITTVRVSKLFAAIKDSQLDQLNVNNDYFHSELNEEVYTSLSLDNSITGSSKVCKLHKSLYGLRHANRQ